MKTIYEIVNNRTNEVLHVYSYSVRVRCKKVPDNIHQIIKGEK